MYSSDIFKNQFHYIKQIALVLILMLSFYSCFAQSKSNIERKQLFDYDWKFFLGDASEAKANNFNDESWRIKNLETLGERSATGMDSERGVYVVTLAEFDSKMRDFLQANDVILRFNRKDVNNLDDLKNAAKQINFAKPV